MGKLEQVKFLKNKLRSLERQLEKVPAVRGGGKSKGLTANGLTQNDDDFFFFDPGSPTFLIRQQIMDLLIDPRHQIDRECGYPSEITPIMYHLLYQRDEVAHRVVNLYPDESWAIDPVVYEVEESEEETAFEEDWNELLKRLNLWYHLHRADILSGVGRFGVVLLGFDDGKPYSEPVVGLGEDGLPTDDGEENHLLFVRTFDETAVQVLQREVNPNNPRYGLPTRYLITFRELDIAEPAMLGTTAGGMTTSQVHWTRVVHLADNRQMSEIYGTSRLKPVWNRICDLRKTIGGAAEMFWKGAFPGIAFELQPGVDGAEMDRDSVEEQMERYSNGFQRWIAAAGMSAKSLTPQVADPRGQLEGQVAAVARALGCPLRIFNGSERGELASSQDQKAWNMRVMRRQDKYVGPMVVRPLVDRLIDLRVVRPPVEGKGAYNVYWEDLNTSTPMEQADLVLKRTQAAQAYITGNVDQLIPPAEYLSMWHSMEPDQIAQVRKSLAEYITGVAGKQWPLVVGSRSQEVDEPGVEGGSGGSQVPETARSTDRKGASVARVEDAAVNPAELS